MRNFVCLAVAACAVHRTEAQTGGAQAWVWTGGSDASVEASPAVLVNANGTSTIYAATYGGSVVAMRGADGSTNGLPSFYEGEMIRSTPAFFSLSSTSTYMTFIAGDALLYAGREFRTEAP